MKIDKGSRSSQEGEQQQQKGQKDKYREKERDVFVFVFVLCIYTKQIQIQIQRQRKIHTKRSMYCFTINYKDQEINEPVCQNQIKKVDKCLR